MSSTKTLSKDGVTISTTDGTFSNGKNYRFYAQSTATVSVTAGTLTKVEFTCTGSGKKNYGPGLWGSPSTGLYTYSGNVGTWKGEAQKFTLTASAQVRATQIAVTYTTDDKSEKTATTLAFADAADKTFKLNQTEGTTFSNIATLTPSVKGATITYKSSDTDVATVTDEGTVTVNTAKAGTAIITASYDGDDTYAKSSASYTITVEATLQLEGEGTKEKPYTVADAIAIVNASKQTTDSIYVKGMVTSVITTEDNIAKYKNCDYYIADSEDATATMEAFRGKYLNNTDVTSTDQILQGDKVVLYGVLTKYNDIIELAKGNYIASFWGTEECIIDETDDNTIEDARHATVMLARTFSSNAWNTLVLPFGMTAEQVTATFGSDTKLANYIGTTLNGDGTYTLNFETTTTITANTPVFVYGAKNVDAEIIEDVNMVAGTPTATPTDAAFAFTGSYKGLTLEAGDWFISSDNKFYRAKGTEAMKATRAIFRPTTPEAAAKGITMVLDDEATAISSVTTGNATGETAPAYNVAGQRVTDNYHGLIIKGGKKYVNK